MVKKATEFVAIKNEFRQSCARAIFSRNDPEYAVRVFGDVNKAIENAIFIDRHDLVRPLLDMYTRPEMGEHLATTRIDPPPAYEQEDAMAVMAAQRQ